jgi:glycosyltransferase involved in cell wall biosynthesis
VFGQGELEVALRQLIAARGLGDRIRLAGFHANPWQYIAQADVFLLTSRYEGFGNVLIEAMACGIPVIATSSPGTMDIVSDEVDGVLVGAHTPRAVADALTRVLGDAALRARLKAGAAASAEKFGLPQTIARYDAVMREALA